MAPVAGIREYSHEGKLRKQQLEEFDLLADYLQGTGVQAGNVASRPHQAHRKSLPNRICGLRDDDRHIARSFLRGPDRLRSRPYNQIDLETDEVLCRCCQGFSVASSKR